MPCKRTTLILSLGLSLGLLVTAAQAGSGITNPTSGSILTTATVTFTGDHPSAGGQHWVYVGSTPGGKEFFTGGPDGNHQFTVSGLPATGTIYVTYWSRPSAASVFESQTSSYTMDVCCGGGGGDGGGGVSALPPWSRSLPGAERFVRVLPTAATPEGEGVLDKETGLVWEQSPDTTARVWEDKFTSPVDVRRHCLRRGTGGKMGWRLPSIHELTSLVVPGNPDGAPDLPAGHPFRSVKSDVYWSATTFVDNPTDAWFVHFAIGDVRAVNKTNLIFVWCVRGGGPLSEY